MATRLHSFREGDRSEYLATYFLSCIGLVNQTLRQEDIGIDFYCQLSDNEAGVLTFGSPFLLQIKSNYSPILYGKKQSDKWTRTNIDWLFRIELPFFIGIIDKSEMKLSIYNTSTLHFLYYEEYLMGNIPSQVEFTLNKYDEELLIGRKEKYPIQNWESPLKGDGFKHQANLGNPIITLTNDELDQKDLLKSKKDILRKIIKVEQKNIIYKNLKLYHFRWVRKNTSNDVKLLAWMYYGLSKQKDEHVLHNLYEELGPSIISLAMCLKANNETDLVKKLKPLFDRIPSEIKYPELKDNLPELFDPTN
jgi:hypothetical protein